MRDILAKLSALLALLAFSTAAIAQTPAPTPPVIVSQTSRVAVEAGEAAMLSVTVVANPVPAFQWRKAGVNLSGATASTLTIPDVQAETNAGTYDVVVANAAGTVVSRPMTLTVSVKTIIQSPPGKPDGLAAGAVESGRFTATWNAVAGAEDYELEVSTTPDFTSVFGYNNLGYNNLGYNNLGYNNLNNPPPGGSGPPTAQVVSNLSAGTTYYFRVRAWNESYGYSPYSNVVTVTTLPSVAPAITGQPIPLIATVGSDATFTVTATGAPPLSYQWKKGANPLSGATGATLTLPAVQPAAAGVYTVVVTNSAGNTVSRPAELTVTTGPAAPRVFPPMAVTATGFTVTWTAVAGVAIYDVEVSTSPDFLNALGYNNLNLNVETSRPITGLLPGTTYFCRVVAVDAAGLATESNTVAVATLPATPATLPATGVEATAFTAHWTTVAGALDYDFEISRSESFTEVLGYNNLGYNNLGYNNLSEGGSRSEEVTGLTAGTMYYYRVAAYNASGASPWSAPRTVTTAASGAPVITAPPASLSVATGAAATFSVTATGTGTLAYQWRRNGAPVAGATGASLALASAQAADAGNYDVVVTNSGGSATSRLAALAVTAGFASPLALPPTQVTTSGFTANWSAVAGATAYDLEVSAQPGFIEVLGYNNLTVGTTQSRPVTGLNAGRTYYYRVTAQDATQVSPVSNTMAVTLPPVWHSADTDRNGRLNLPELCRVIELYNTRQGTTRTGRYAVLAGTEDGFTLDPVSTTNQVLAAHHSADANRDGQLGLDELTRVIELYNFRAGTIRTGQFRVQSGTADGFAPGP